MMLSGFSLWMMLVRPKILATYVTLIANSACGGGSSSQLILFIEGASKRKSSDRRTKFYTRGGGEGAVVSIHE